MCCKNCFFLFLKLKCIKKNLKNLQILLFCLLRKTVYCRIQSLLEKTFLKIQFSKSAIMYRTRNLISNTLLN